MVRIKLLIVLYNKIPKESETILSLSKIKDSINDFVEIYIWDNSSRCLESDQFHILDELLYPITYNYHGDGLNTPLSKIYNIVIKNELFGFDSLVIFDHDSAFDISYLSALMDALNNYTDVNLFLPIIKYNNKIVSPANLYYFKGSYWRKEKIGLVRAKNQTAINSGMCIRSQYLINEFPGYDENLLFYGTDDDFMDKYTIQNTKFYVINSVINHTLDFFDTNDLESKSQRYTYMKKAALYRMYKKGYLVYFFARVYYLLFSLKLAYMYKNTKFLY